MASGASHPGSNPGEDSVKNGSRRFESCAGKDEIASGFCVTYASRYVAKAQLKLISESIYWVAFGFCETYASRYVSTRMLLGTIWLL